MRILIFISLLFLLGRTSGQSSGIGIHVGNVPDCGQLFENMQQDNALFSSQCYSLGLSYHHFMKNNLVLAFRIQYQNKSEEVERKNELNPPNGQFFFKEINTINQSQKDILLLPNIYWIVGDDNLKPIIGFGLPISLAGVKERNLINERENIFNNSNVENKMDFQSNNKNTTSGGIAVGLMANFGMSYQLGSKIQLRFSYTPTLFFQNNSNEVKNTFNSVETRIIIENGRPSDPIKSFFSDNQNWEEQVKGIIFQEEAFLFTLFYQF